MRRTAVIWMFAMALAGHLGAEGAAQQPFAIEVVEKGVGWPVPLVELRTNHHVSFFTDNAGVVAMDLPELMGHESWLEVAADGYEVPQDGFGYRGVRCTPEPGGHLRIEVARTQIAKRLGRITGAGLFAESQKLGHDLDWPETGILGCDSVQNAVHGGKMCWAWGDTGLAPYPLGIFHTSSATSSLRPLDSFEPPLRLKLDYVTDNKGQPRAVAQMPGDGPTWLSGYVNLPDASGRERLVATYSKIPQFLDSNECGLCMWNDETSQFEQLRTIWKKSDASPKHPPLPDGNPVLFDEDGKRWVLFGNPLPNLRCPATFEAWQDPAQWERIESQAILAAADDGAPIKPHSGSIAWNDFRKRWVTVFMQEYGKPSALGELWYAEAKSPRGPWGPAVKIVSHANRTFYNPRMHPEFTPADSPILLFEGTYSQLFTDHAPATPRYEYNQIMYRIDLDDPQLAPARIP